MKTCPCCKQEVQLLDEWTRLCLACTAVLDYLDYWEERNEKMTKIYYVDVPDYSKPGEWRNITTTETKEQAQLFLWQKYGILPSQSDVFIIEGIL